MQQGNSQIEAFRQFQATVRGSNTHLIVGIDVAKRMHVACVGNDAGKVLVKRLRFENHRDGFSKLLETVERLKRREGLCEAVFAVEPTANYHKPLAEFLAEGGHRVVLVSTVAVAHNRRLRDGRWDKNDPKDAANIVDLVSQGKCQFFDRPAVEVRELRSLLGLRRKLSQMAQRVQLRLRNHVLAQVFPELDAYAQRSFRFVRPIIEWTVLPTTIAGMTFEAWVKRVHPTAKRRATHTHLRAIYAAAKTSIGTVGAGAAMQTEATVLAKQWQGLETELQALETQIQAIAMAHPSYGALVSIPGVGPQTAATLLSIIGDPFRFRSAKQVLRLAGFDLVASRSGERSAHAQPCLSKCGNATLRYALVQAATIGSNANPLFRAYLATRLLRREKEPGIKTKLRVKLAAKLLLMAWTLMKTGQTFDPQRFGLTELPLHAPTSGS
jgi:transposase